MLKLVPLWFCLKSDFFQSFAGDDNSKLMQNIIEELQNVKTQTRSNERRACMTQLIRLAREGNIAIIKEKFRYVP